MGVLLDRVRRHGDRVVLGHDDRAQLGPGQRGDRAVVSHPLGGLVERVGLVERQDLRLVREGPAPIDFVDHAPQLAQVGVDLAAQRTEIRARLACVGDRCG